MADSLFPNTDASGRQRVAISGDSFSVQSPAALTASGQSATFTNLGNAGNIQISAKGTYGFTTTPPTYVFEGSDDGGTSWFPLSVVREDLAFKESGGTLAANTTRAWVLDLGGLDMVRVRITAWGTPTGSISFRASPGGTLFEPPAGVVPTSKTNLHLVADAATPATSNTLVSLSRFLDGVAQGAAATTHTPPAGKKWRITSFTVSWRNTSAAIHSVTGMLRINPTGAVVATSPLLATATGSANAATIGVGNTGIIMFPEGGIQIDPGQNIGVSAIGSLAAAGMYISVLGYEY